MELGAGNDRFVGSPFAETVNDGLGADNVQGYAPGGGGNDLFIQPDSGNPAVDDAGDFFDTAYEQGVVDYSRRTNGQGVRVTLHTGGPDDGAPGEGDTVNAHGVRGTSYADELHGLGVEDFFFESLWGGPGNDVLKGYAGADLLHGGPGEDEITGGLGNDLIAGDAGADTLLAADGDPDVVLCGIGIDAVEADPPSIDAAVEPAGPAEAGCEGVTRVVPAPVDTVIDSKPPAVTNNPAPSVAFSSNYAGASFECSLNAGAYVPCASPVSQPLPDGPHTLLVRARSGTRVDETPAEVRTTVDSLPPDTSLTAVPGGAVHNLADLDLTSNEPGVQFECAIDGGAYSSCADPLDVSNLPAGTYTLAVRAVDAAGNKDSSPAPATFTVVNSAPALQPSTSPDSGPSALDVVLALGASDADGDALTYRVEFGDGSGAKTGRVAAGPVAHTYSQPGVYTVSVEVKDGRATTTADATVTVVPPQQQPSGGTAGENPASPGAPAQPKQLAAAAPQVRLPAESRVTANLSGRVRLTFACSATAASCDAAAYRLVVRAGTTTVRVPLQVAGLATGNSEVVTLKLPRKVATAVRRAGTRGLRAKLQWPAGFTKMVTLITKRR